MQYGTYGVYEISGRKVTAINQIMLDKAKDEKSSFRLEGSYENKEYKEYIEDYKLDEVDICCVYRGSSNLKIYIFSPSEKRKEEIKLKLEEIIDTALLE